MKNKIESRESTELETGLCWVEEAISAICVMEKHALPLISWQDEDNGLFQTLSMRSSDGRRISKLFSHHELRSCFNDPDVQKLVKARLLHLLNYLYSAK